MKFPRIEKIKATEINDVMSEATSEVKSDTVGFKIGNSVLSISGRFLEGKVNGNTVTRGETGIVDDSMKVEYSFLSLKDFNIGDYTFNPTARYSSTVLTPIPGFIGKLDKTLYVLGYLGTIFAILRGATK